MAYFRMYGSNIIVPQTKTMTVILDLNNPDPTTWATYADDAVGMTAGSAAWDTFFGHYPCILDNGVELGKLKRSNFAQYEDGTSAPITTLGKDVMICFPRRGIKIEYTDSSHLSVSMTDEEGKSGYSYMGHSYNGNTCDKFYLGAYRGYGTSSSLYSLSGKIPTTSQTINTFRSWARARGTGYEQSAFYQLTFRQVMYLLKYKGQNAQNVIGTGYAFGSSSGLINTGYTNANGMDWGETTGNYPVKLFGLEDFYGSANEFIDGIIVISSSRKMKVADGNYSNTDYYTEIMSTAGYSKNPIQAGYLKRPIGSNIAGFLSVSTNYGSDSTYFCDYSQTYAFSNESSYNDVVCVYGGIWGGAAASGPFRINLSDPSTYQKNSNSSRLMYMHVA